jgi:murein DD-endopeptidase MepM/ murein hydrolase activator NlpD
MIVSQRSKRFLRRVAVVILLVLAVVGSLAGRAYLLGRRSPSANPTSSAVPPLQVQSSPVRPTESSTRGSAHADEPQTTLTPTSQPTEGKRPPQVRPTPTPTPTPERVITYTVREGDSLWSIAARFGLDVDTLRWSNEDLARNPDLLSVGQKLIILPIKGAYHTVQEGETVEAIALAYGVTPTVIMDYPLNDLQPPYQLRESQKLIIPGGRRELHWPQPDLSLESPFAWPVVGEITQGYSEEHPALDLGAPYGSPVYAAKAGTVTHSGWARTGYGYTVILDHDEGVRSLYSHMKGTWVTVGQKVERGQLIGEVGSTGHSSGPHVHFEIRVDGGRVDPSSHVPAAPPH